MINEKDYKARTYINKRPKKKRTSKMCVNCSNCNDRKICKDRKDISCMKKCEICNNCTDREHCDIFNFQIEHKVTIPIGRDEETGKIIRKSFSAQTESEAIYRAVQYQKTMVHSAEHTIIPRTKHSIVSIVEEYENRKLASGIIGENAYSTHMATLNRIRKNYWANISIKQVSRKQIEDFLIHERNRGLSNSCLKKDVGMLKLSFDIALGYNYIDNTQHYFLGKYGVLRPKSIKKDKKVKALTVDEQAQFTNYLITKDSIYKNLFILLLNTGIRIGEALALQIFDVDFKNNCLYITKTITQDKSGKAIIGETTKTANGERKILLTEITRPILENAIAKQIPNENNLIFTTQTGKIYAESTINGGLKRILKNLNINTENISTHSLRHTFITRSNEAGVDAVETKTNVGHSNIHMTQDIYNENQDPYLTEQMKKYTEYMKEKMKI